VSTTVIRYPRVNSGARSSATPTNKLLTLLLVILYNPSLLYRRFLQRSKDLVPHDEHAGPAEDHLLAHPVLLDVGLAGVVSRSGLAPHGGNVQFIGCFEDIEGDLSVDNQTYAMLVENDFLTFAGVTTLTDVWMGSFSSCKDLIAASPSSSVSFWPSTPFRATV